MITPRVSILMPIYNTSVFLREAVDSVLNQTYTDFELICLDDCSPDNASEIMDCYSDNRIVRYRGKKNVGLSNILNIGIEMAKGEYIARMDSDDISLPERLAIQIQYMECHPDVDLCSCGMELFGDKQEVWIRSNNIEEVKIESLFHSPILHASSVWRRNSFEKHGLIYNQSKVPAEDYDLWTRALVKGLKLVNIPQVLYKYRIHKGQSTSSIDKSYAICDKIRLSYIQSVFPKIAIDEIFLNNVYSEEDLNKLKHTVNLLLIENSVVGFFNQHLLQKKLYNNYYSQVYDLLNNNFKISLLKEFNIKWLYKYLLGRLYDK